MRCAIVLTCLVVVPGLGAVYAGDLDPSAPPGPTMKSLDEIAPTWSQQLDSTNGDAAGCNSDRFKCVLNDEAVLDMETGLVWERVPDIPYGTPWLECIDACQGKLVGDRGGWRLPTAEEIFSLVDESSGFPRLPDSHPFSGLQDATWYYSTTSVATDDTKAWVLVSDLIQNYHNPGQAPKVGVGTAWCVRGGVGDAVR